MILGSRSAAFVVVIAAFLVTVLLNNNSDNPVLKGRKDNSAEGVAKARHAEFMLEPSDRLYNDPYACYMFRGCFAQEWLGSKGTKAISDFIFKGVFELLTLRTKWIDDEIRKRVVEDDELAYEQMLILGAGYDTRGFRLEFLPNNFKVLEIDQPEVQTSKRKKLQNIIDDENKIEGNGSVVSSKLIEKQVEFVPIDFNDAEYSLGAALSSSSFDSIRETIVLLEGVTQYIPKSSTETALRQLHQILPVGSILLVSYVPEQCIPTAVSGENDNNDRVASPTYRPEMCGPQKLANLFLNFICPLIGEPWISGWTVAGFEKFLKPLGFQVVSDTTLNELNEKYLKPLGRDLKEHEILSLERYVAATVVEQ